MAKYRLKVLLDVEVPVRDDALARSLASSLLSRMGIKEGKLTLEDQGIPVSFTLVSEEGRDGRNLFAPVPAGKE
jgi:hypothetical protein